MKFCMIMPARLATVAMKRQLAKLQYSVLRYPEYMYYTIVVGRSYRVNCTGGEIDGSLKTPVAVAGYEIDTAAVCPAFCT